jgi:hypothetical protein
MTLAFQTTTDTGEVAYLREHGDGTFRLTAEPIHAAMWLDDRDLSRWLAALPPEARDRLAARPGRIVELDLDLTGVTGAQVEDASHANERHRMTLTQIKAEAKPPRRKRKVARS